MKTKREVLEEFARKGYCTGFICSECAYSKDDCPKHLKVLTIRLAKIGAMAILRMFKKKKKPTLQSLSRIRFSDGRFAMVFTRPGDDKPLLDFGDGVQTLDYLFNRTWEIVE